MDIIVYYFFVLVFHSQDKTGSLLVKRNNGVCRFNYPFSSELRALSSGCQRDCRFYCYYHYYFYYYYCYYYYERSFHGLESGDRLSETSLRAVFFAFFCLIRLDVDNANVVVD